MRDSVFLDRKMTYIHNGIEIILWAINLRQNSNQTQNHVKLQNHVFHISTLMDLSVSQNRQPILAQPHFHTLYKSGQCSPKHKLFSFFFGVIIDETFSHKDIWKISENVSQFLFGRLLKKCQLFETPGTYIKFTIYFS